MEKMDPYSVLGVARDADDETIKKAFRHASKSAHPDAGGDAEQFATVKRASLVLLDPTRRRKFDNTGEIDDDAVDRTEASAYGLISSLIDNVLMGDPDPLANPLIEPMVAFLVKQVQGQEETIGQLDRARSRAERMMKRFSKKKRKKKKDDPPDDGLNVMEMLLKGKIGEIDKSVKATKMNLATVKRALAIVEEYQYDFDKMVQRASPYVQYQGGGFGYNTTTSGGLG